MRKRLLQGVNVFFTKHIWIIAVLWLVWMLVDIVLGLVVFPTARGGIWYVGLGGTLGFVICLAAVSVLRAIFHKRVIETLAHQKGSNA